MNTDVNTQRPSWYRRIYNELKNYEHSIEGNMFILKYNQKRYTIDVGNYYPFRPPELILSNQHIISYSPKLYPNRLWTEYQKETGECMCCHNLLCPDNWSPANNIVHVIDEYEAFIDRLKTIQKKRIFQSVNLPDDMIYYICMFL